MVTVQLDEAAADLAGAADLVLDVGAVAPADGAGHGLGVLGEAGEHLQQGLAVVEEDVAPHGRVGGGDAGEVAKARGGELQDLVAGLALQVVGGAADGEGDQVGQVTDHGDDAVVVGGLHDLGHGAAAAPEFCHALGGVGVGAGGGGEQDPAALEQRGKTGVGAGVLGAGHGVAGDEVHAGGDERADVAQDGELGGADVGEHAAGGEVGGDGGGDGGAGADGGAQDHAVGVAHGDGGVGVGAVGDAEGGDAGEDVGGVAGDDLGGQLAAQGGGAGEGAADQAEADDGEAAEHRGAGAERRRRAALVADWRVGRGRGDASGGVGHAADCGAACAMKPAKASATRSTSSAVPMVMRRQVGRP